MDPRRLQNERDRLERLAAASGGVVSVRHAPDLRHYDITLRVNAPVGTSRDYAVVGEHTLTLDLTDDFPMLAPVPKLSTQVLVPNVWPSRVPCIVAMNWTPNQHLDQVVCDVLEEIQGFGPNLNSIANPVAGDLFQDRAFVTELLQRLGPPVRLIPPVPEAAPRRGGIETVSGRADQRKSIQTVPGAGARRRGIETVRD